MASVTRKSQGGRTGWRIRFYLGDRRKEIYLAVGGKRGESMAQKIAIHIDNLAQSKTNNVPPDPAAVAWANKTEGSLRENLVSWGLADPINKRRNDDSGRLLGAFFDAYMETRSDLQQSTKEQYRQSRRLLIEYFGESKPIRSITVADAEKFKRWLLQSQSEASTSKHIKRAKTLFQFAVNDQLLDRSPFDTIKAGSDVNHDRQRFIDRKTIEKVLMSCPDADWRLIFGLSRFCGLRCPSEVCGLKWTDIDWEGGKIRIESPKTGLRFCPIFPAVRSILAEAFDLAPDGAVHVVGRYRSDSNLRTQAHRIIESAGVVPWPKLFNNLRASCRTELQEKFPSHVCDSWMGHSTEVAAKHYLQTTDDHWAAANDFGSPTGSPISTNIGPISTHQQNKKPPENTLFDASRGLGVSPLITRLGFEQSPNIAGNSNNPDPVPPPVPPLATIDQDFTDLITLWQSMDQEQRAAMLAVARGMIQY